MIPSPPSFQAVTTRIDRQLFWPLPTPLRADGAPRRTGLEIEFAGLGRDQAGAVIAALWGGRREDLDPHRLRLCDTALGPVTVELDTALSRSGVEGLVLDALGDLVPLEIVTPPLGPDTLAEADRLVAALRAAGARGTRAALRFGFGLHLNPEIADPAHAVAVARAYGLLEDWLRAADPIDPARRALPFVDPWPRALVDALAADGAQWDMGALAQAYLTATPTRNRGLDLLPLLEHLEPARVADALPEGQAKGGRPTFHYRLPEARVDEADWSVAYEWNRWVVVERVASRPALLAALSEEWQAHRAALFTIRSDWARTVDEHLRAARIWIG
ncbi:MAG: amidoligase family protein [Alkalilacustris sp.]